MSNLATVVKQAQLLAFPPRNPASLDAVTLARHVPLARHRLRAGQYIHRAGEPLTDAKGRRSYVTSAGAAPSVGKHVVMAYLPPEQAVVGTELAVEYLGERYPVTVDVAGSTPIFDPENTRIRS